MKPVNQKNMKAKFYFKDVYCRKQTFEYIILTMKKGPTVVANNFKSLKEVSKNAASAIFSISYYALHEEHLATPMKIWSSIYIAWSNKRHAHQPGDSEASTSPQSPRGS